MSSSVRGPLVVPFGVPARSNPNETVIGVDNSGNVVASIGGADFATIAGGKVTTASVAPLVSNDQQMLLTPLTGDTDGGYTIRGFVSMPAGGGSQKNFTLRFNSTAPSGDAVSSVIYAAGASVSGDGGQVATAMNICYQGSARSAGWFHFVIRVSSKSGVGQGLLFEATSVRDDGQVQISTAVWKETASPVTSIQIFGSAANTVLTTSECGLVANGVPGN